MAERRNRELLDWSGRCQQEEGSVLPSWVVDWRSHPWIQYINHEEWCAGGKDFRPIAERVPKKKKQHYLNRLLQSANEPTRPLKFALQITIMMQDSVAYLSGVLNAWKYFDDISTLHNDVLDLDQKAQTFINAMLPSKYITSDPVADAYNATLIANTTDRDAIASPEDVAKGAEELAIVAFKRCQFNRRHDAEVSRRN